MSIQLNSTQSYWCSVGALFGATAVALGAFGAHSLKSRITDTKLLETWTTASHYHLIHSAVVCLAGIIVPHHQINWSNRLFTTGITIFSGSLYLLVLTGQRKFGMITPIGGLSLIAGWVALAMRV